MNPHRAIASRWLVTLLLLAAWFGATNHCALGFMQGAGTAKEHAGCCSHKTQKPLAPAGNMPVKECCKALQGMLPAAEKTFASQPSLDFTHVWLALCEGMASASVKKAGAFCFETGPPGEVRSFAELVLQRSLRSHAPPILA